MNDYLKTYDFLFLPSASDLGAGRDRDYSIPVSELQPGSDRYHTQGTGWAMRLTDGPGNKPRYVYFGALNAGFDVNEGNQLAAVAEYVVAIAVTSPYVLDSLAAFDGRFPNLEAVNIEGKRNEQPLTKMSEMMSHLPYLKKVQISDDNPAEIKALFENYRKPSGGAQRPGTKDTELPTPAPAAAK